MRVYKSANVYNSITDFSLFVDDTIRVIESCQRQDVSADPNLTVQAFIDLCARHEERFYRFVHEVHCHDNGLFDQLMGWLEDVLAFLRQGPRSGRKLDINALFQRAVDDGGMDAAVAHQEVQALVRWQMARKRWHQDKTRQKMARGEGDNAGTGIGFGASPVGDGFGFTSSDFGIDEVRLAPVRAAQAQSSLFLQQDLADLSLSSDDEDDEDSSDDADADFYGDDNDSPFTPSSPAPASPFSTSAPTSRRRRATRSASSVASASALASPSTGTHRGSDADDGDRALPAAVRRDRRKRRAREQRRRLRASAGEPAKPDVVELRKLGAPFLDMLRSVLGEKDEEGASSAGKEAMEKAG